MSLTIKGNIVTAEGISVENAYGRVAVVNGPAGDQISAEVQFYASQEVFEAGARYLQFNGLLNYKNIPYVYEPDTVNILDIAHDALIEVLAAQGIEAEKSL